MKKILYLIAAMVMLLSCSDNDKKADGVLDCIPANADLVIVGNINKIAESAGGSVKNSQIVLPKDVMEHLGTRNTSILQKINRLLNGSHVNTEACALFASYENEQPVVVLSINDAILFTDAIKALKYKKIKADCNMDIYARKIQAGADGNPDCHNYVALNGNYAYIIENVQKNTNFSPAGYLQKIYEDARKNSFAETAYGKYISEDCTIGVAMANTANIKKSLKKTGMLSGSVSILDKCIVCLRGNLLADKCIVDIQLFDHDGNEMRADSLVPFMNNSSTISKKALAFLDAKESVAYAISLKDVEWDKYMDMISEAAELSRSDRAQLNAVLNYLENIDGTVAASFSTNNGINSILNIYMGKDLLSQFSATIVAETKEGKAKRLLEDLKGLLEGMSIHFDETDCEISVNTAFMGMPGTVYAKSKDDVLIVANHPIKENNDNIFIKDKNLTESRFALYAKLDKEDKLASELNINDNVTAAFYCRPDMMSAFMVIEIGSGTDANTGIISRLLNMVRKDGKEPEMPD